MRIYVPDMELVGTLKFARDIYEKVPNGEVIFDFSKMSNFDPLAMLIMGATMRNYINKYPKISFKIGGYEEKKYAGTMGFFKYVSDSLGIGKKPGEANGSTNYIPITPIIVDKLQQDEISQGNYMVVGDLIEKEAGRLACIVDRGNKELHKLLT